MRVGSDYVLRCSREKSTYVHYCENRIQKRYYAIREIMRKKFRRGGVGKRSLEWETGGTVSYCSAYQIFIAVNTFYDEVLTVRFLS